jgi:hypothetical protein
MVSEAETEILLDRSACLDCGSTVMRFPAGILVKGLLPLLGRQGRGGEDQQQYQGPWAGGNQHFLSARERGTPWMIPREMTGDVANRRK